MAYLFLQEIHVIKSSVYFEDVVADKAKSTASRLWIAIHVSESNYEHGCGVQSIWGVQLQCLFRWAWQWWPYIWNWWWWLCSWKWQQWWQGAAAAGGRQWTCQQFMFIGHKDPPPPPSLIDKTSNDSSCSSTWGQHDSCTLQEQPCWASVESKIKTNDYTVNLCLFVCFS